LRFKDGSMKMQIPVLVQSQYVANRTKIMAF
jgi:hypothetical protein